MGKIIVITGGAGFIGSHLTRELLERGYAVRVIENFLYGERGLDGLRHHRGLNVIRGDMCDREILSHALQGAHAAIALGALVGDAACDLNPQRAMEINYESTHSLLDVCRKKKIERIVFASSCSVYGANGDCLLNEDSPLNPISVYARTRVMSEKLLLEQTDLDVVVLRLATVCGVSPRMRFDLMVNTMTACAAAEGVVRVSGGQQWRPHVHVRDAAEAFALAVEPSTTASGVFNVGCDDQNFTIAQVAEKVAGMISGVRVEHQDDSGDPRSYRVTFSRIREVMGFRPRRTVDDAILEVRNLLKNGEVKDFRDESYHNARWLSGRAHHLGAA